MEARGHTLLEIIVALGILATIGMVSLLAMHAWLPDMRLRVEPAS